MQAKHIPAVDVVYKVTVIELYIAVLYCILKKNKYSQPIFQSQNVYLLDILYHV